MKNFVTLCYHYIRTEDESDPFKKLLGSSEEQFYSHLESLSKVYDFISLSDVYDFLYEGKSSFSDKS